MREGRSSDKLLQMMMAKDAEVHAPTVSCVETLSICLLQPPRIAGPVCGRQTGSISERWLSDQHLHAGQVPGTHQ